MVNFFKYLPSGFDPDMEEELRDAESLDGNGKYLFEFFVLRI